MNVIVRGSSGGKTGALRRTRSWDMMKMMTVMIVMMMMTSLTPTGASDPRVDALSSVLREITGQLERINNVYINKLERELSTSTAKIAAMEATVRGIADRAAAWDNIQNHMTVWTDQSRTMERKLDILNRCHEKQETWESRLNAVDALNHKLTALDKKINAMTRLEFKVEQVSERVEEVDSKINWMKKQMHAPETPIITEFAGRGLLSSLLNIETKLDNLTTKISDEEVHSTSGGDYTSYKRTRVYGTRVRQLRPTVEPEPGITMTYDGEETCHLHPRDSRRLQDVSAKVDLVFDRITDPDYDYDVFVSHLPRPSQLSAQTPHNGNTNNNSNNGDDPNEPSPEHLFARFWKSLFSPFKKINRRFRGFENQLNSIQRSCNETVSLEGYATELGGVLQQKLRPLDQALREEMEETRVAVNDQSSNIEKVSQAVSNTAYMSEQLLSEIKNQFQAQRIIFQEKFDETRNLFLQYCASGNGGNPAPRQPPYTPRESPKYPPREEPYSPAIPQEPVLTTPRTPYYPSVTQATPSSRNNWIQPPETEPNIRTLQGERSFYGNRHRLAYKYNDRPRVKAGKTNRKSQNRRKSDRSRRGKVKHKNDSSYSFQDKTTEHLTHRNRSQSQRHYNQQHIQGVQNREARRRQTRSVPDQPSTPFMFEIRDCTDLLKERIMQRTLYNFAADKKDFTSEGHDYFTRYCDMETNGGGWTVIQRRGMFGHPYENFTMPWNDYKNGFGDMNREFWWGNDNIYRIVRDQDTTIRFDLWDFEGNYAFAEYLSFSIGDETQNYKLSVFGYQGNASDSFSAHNGYLFSTFDRDNDEAPECCPCAPAYGGGWWFYSCFESNLNGEYHLDPKDNDYYRGIIWELWLGDYSLKATEIKIRPTSFASNGSQGGDALPIPQPTVPHSTPHPDPYPGPRGTLSPELPLRRKEE